MVKGIQSDLMHMTSLLHINYWKSGKRQCSCIAVFNVTIDKTLLFYHTGHVVLVTTQNWL